MMALTRFGTPSQQTEFDGLQLRGYNVTADRIQ
jgi:hypothetical protein